MAQTVKDAVEALPRPKDGMDGKDGKDGRSLTVEDLAPVIASEVERVVEAQPKAKDGIGISGALIDRAGHLVVTLSNGLSTDVGPVVGRDADPDELRRLVLDAVAQIPRPKDGRDGIDGVGFDDLAIEYDGERGFSIVFIKGEQRKSFGPYSIPTVLYREVWKDGKAYEKGDAVTWGGSLYIAREANIGAKPGGAGAESRVWVMAVKEGREGKPGKPGGLGPQGPKGDKGEPGPRWQ